MKKIADKIMEWIEKEVKKSKTKGVVYGLSGGIDSAVISVLCKKIFPENSLALILPCHSLNKDIEDALELIKKFKINYKLIELTNTYDQFSSLISGSIGEADMDESLAKANIKPRLRMITLYYYANCLNYLVVGTSNRSEIMVGYATKYGDSGADILPLGNLLKTQVFELAKYLGVTKDIINKPPSAGLWKGQTDEKELGITYAQLDAYLCGGEIRDDRIKERIQKRIKSSRHKRTVPAKPSL